ncbi:uncharacterized protein [Amphiura filiformis]|uniref:uncharacterized protein n=1 Tax=Amphiura filiformis TaxID=82378 RepID=UPI003B222109
MSKESFAHSLLHLPTKLKQCHHKKKQAKSLVAAKRECRDLVQKLVSFQDYTTTAFAEVLCAWSNLPFKYFVPADKNMSSDESFCTPEFPEFCHTLEAVIVESGYVELMIGIATAMLQYTQDAELCQQALHNFCLLCWGILNFFDERKKIVSKKFIESGGVLVMVKALGDLKHCTFRTQTAEFLKTRATLQAMSILVNCCDGNEEAFRRTNCTEVLTGYIQTENIGIKVFAVLILASIANEQERGLLRSTDCVRFMVELLKKAVQSENHAAIFVAERDVPEPMKLSFSITELLQRLNRLAINDSNKLEMYNLGVTALVAQILNGEFKEEEQEYAVKVLWSLAFVENIRNDATVQSSTQVLRRMQSSNNTSLQEASSYALWEIEGNELRYLPPTRSGASENPPPTYEETLLEGPQDDEEAPPPSYQEVVVERQLAANKNKRCHVMLSYQESSKQCVRAIKERLVREGHKVWMDENNSSDIASMAKAIEMAEVVLLCMSEKYKDSSNCRSGKK